ncbi:MAG: hypothetical protein M3094_09520, partial [Actinomycetia bacterium]|nr:hypothetical protein [Actinomycetes bacterium]
LSVELASPIAPDRFEECWLAAVLLPSDTTLNDIGRGDTWPAGGFRTGLGNAAWIEESLAPGVTIQSGGRIPIVAMGPTGGMAWLQLQPDERSGIWDASLPPPTPLPAGVYDLRVTEMCNTAGEDDHDENRRCGVLLGVEVNGDTVVQMPDLGACP